MHDEPDDDAQIGRVLSRRDAVRLLAVSGAAVMVGCQQKGSPAADTTAISAGGDVITRTDTLVPGCVVKPELTLGPYFVDRQLDRSDVRTEPTTGKVVEGAPLVLAFNVSDVSGGQCHPLAGAMVDIWQCDAKGVYSGVVDQTVGFDTQGQKFLRGYQVTDASGVARFTTIYPGWYPGRTVHIHFKIRTPATAALAGSSTGVWDFTSQLFFDESLSDRVFAQAPYAGKGKRDTTNATDNIYRESNGQLLLSLAPGGQGYDGTFAIGLDLSDAAVGRPDAMGRGGGPGGRRGRGAPI